VARPARSDKLAAAGCGYDVLGANRDLAGAEVELVGVERRERRLQAALADRAEYDFILIDCPPSLSMLTLNGLSCAHGVLVPMQCEYFALEGLTDLVNTIKQVRANMNKDLAVIGLLRVMYDPRITLQQQVSDQLKAHFADKVFDTVIPRNVRLAEAPSYGVPGVVFDPSSKGALAYVAFAEELVDRVSHASDCAPGACNHVMLLCSYILIAHESNSTVLCCPAGRTPGPQHWQSRWEQLHGYRAGRTTRLDAALARRLDARLEEVVLARAEAGAGTGLVLVAHSLGCQLVAAWAAHSPCGTACRARCWWRQGIRSARNCGQLASWSPAVLQRLPFPQPPAGQPGRPLLQLRTGAAFADAWGAEFVDYGAAAINADSGLGDWPRRPCLAATARPCPGRCLKKEPAPW
jgi:chromosome partitioning protein